MKKRLVLLGVYFALTPLFLISLVFYQFYLYHQTNTSALKILGAAAQDVEYKALPNITSPDTIKVTGSEARIDVLREYFSKYKSPLVDYADEMVAASDKYSLDYRLLPAIAMKESTLCLKAPKGLNNCWGFGIYGTKRTGFDDYGHAIEVISKTLARDYHGIGLIEPVDIMTKYTPSSDGSWAETVTYVMNTIEASL